mgnify:CR=1 FL=1
MFQATIIKREMLHPQRMAEKHGGWAQVTFQAWACAPEKESLAPSPWSRRAWQTLQEWESVKDTRHYLPWVRSRKRECDYLQSRFFPAFVCDPRFPLTHENVWGYACVRGCLALAQWWHQHSQPALSEEYVSLVFVSACHTGRPAVVAWMWRVWGAAFLLDQLEAGLLAASRAQSLDTLSALVGQDGVKERTALLAVEQYYDACEHGNLSIAQWWRDRWNATEVGGETRWCTAFKNACYHGHLDTVQHLWAAHPFSSADLQECFQCGFCCALRAERLNVAQWLWTERKHRRPSEGHAGFRVLWAAVLQKVACDNQHNRRSSDHPDQPVLAWAHQTLQAWSEEDRTRMVLSVFGDFCRRGVTLSARLVAVHFPSVLTWTPATSDVLVPAFWQAGAHGHLTLLRWWTCVCPALLPAVAHDLTFFLLVCRQHRLPVMRWMSRVVPGLQHKLQRDAYFRHACSRHLPSWSDEYRWFASRPGTPKRFCSNVKRWAGRMSRHMLCFPRRDPNKIK